MTRSFITRFVLLSLWLLCGSALAQDDIPAARVVLPWRDFKDLYDKGMAPEAKPDVAPRDYAVSRAVYTGRVEDDSTVFTARFRVEVLKAKGWTAVPLLPTSVALRQARVGGSEAPVYLDSGWYTYITDRSGPVTIDLEFAVSTWESSGQNGFTFELARSGATEVTVAVPAEDTLDFEVAGAQQVSDSTRGGDRVLHALLPATGNLAVTWQRAADEIAPEDLVARVYAEHQALIGVGEGVLSGSSTVHYSILHAGVESFQVSLPEALTVLDVQGKGIRDWKVTDSASQRVIDVDLNFEAKGAWSMRVDYERALAEGDGTVEVPQLTIADVERVKGWVGIDARSNLEVSAGDVSEARVVDVRELPPAILGQTDWPVLLGFTYRESPRGEGEQTPWRIPLVLRQHDDVDMLVTIIDQVSASTVLTPDGRRMTQVTYAMRNNRAQYLRLRLPEGATPWSTFVAGRAARPALAEDGRVMIPLARSQASGGDLARFAVEIVYVEDGEAPSEKGRGEFEGHLPTADVPSTAVAWTVYLPRGGKLRKRTVEGAMRRVDWFTPIDVAGATAPEAAYEVQQQANAYFESEASAAGVQPVRVTLPVDGVPVYFEKLLVLDESLDVSFAYQGVR